MAPKTLALILIAFHQFSQGHGHRSTDSVAETVALTEFRELVDHLAYREFMKSDGYLIRWLEQTNFDAYEAADKFSEFVEWRRMKKVDSIVFEDFSGIDKEHLIAFNLVDKAGRPGIYVPFGSFDIRKIAIAGAQDLYQRYMIRMYEMSEIYLHQLRASRPNVTHMVAIYDLTGFNLKMGGCFQCVSMIPELISNFDPNYPGLFYKAFLINTPSIFLTALRISESFMSEKTRKSLILYGYDKSEWIPALHDQFPSEQLPKDFEGLGPSFHSKSAKEAQMNFLADLLQNVRAAVRRDMKNSDDYVESAHELTTATINSTNVSMEAEHPPETEKQRHHHHYRIKENRYKSISAPAAGRGKSRTHYSSSGSHKRLQLDLPALFMLLNIQCSVFVLFHTLF